MPRFFIDKSDISENRITIFGEDAKHLLLSLRAKPGESYTLCDSCGTDFLCTLAYADKASATFDILKALPNLSEPNAQVTLYMALVKSDKLETVIQKSVELGVNRIVPVLTKRCVSRPDEKSMLSKLERWNKISKEAAGQSGRGIIPKVSELLDTDRAFEAMKKSDVSFICYENENRLSLKELLNSHSTKKSPKTFSFMVGPEGGFEESETQKARDMGICSVSLGKRILRAETAPLCVLSAIMFSTGNLG